MNTDALAFTPGDFRLNVRNFGPIAEATVELRPLTVFVGPSNTGKSYLATLLYALHRSFGEHTSRSHFQRFIDPFPYGAADFDAAAHRDLHAWLSDTKDDGPIPPLPQSIELALRRSIGAPSGLAERIAQKTRWCFGVDSLQRLVRHGQRAAAHVSLQIPRPSRSGELTYQLDSRKNELQLSGRIADASPLYRDCDPDILLGAVRLRGPLLSLGYVAEGGADSDLDPVLHQLTATVLRSLLHPFQRSAYYLPADRTGVMHSHRVVVSSLIRSAANAGLRPTSDLPLLPGVLADFLDQLLKFGGPDDYVSSASSGSTGMDPVAQRFERAVLQGEVRTESTTANYPEFLYRPDGWRRDLSLTQASSMVSELAPIVLYLRHLVRPGDVLIVEEPEAHLHPAMQVNVMRRLAELVNADVRIVVTTHSEWVLEELANLVRSSQVGDSGDTGLRPDRVGVWRFHPPSEAQGARVTELAMDDAGLFQAGYEQVAMEVHNRWADISGLVNNGE